MVQEQRQRRPLVVSLSNHRLALRRALAQASRLRRQGEWLCQSRLSLSLANQLVGACNSKARCNARTASGTLISSIIQVIRISDVVIISMLIPASDSARNMVAA